jgi:prepilin-type N-terminal cleavage/methylation domain-containing protein
MGLMNMSRGTGSIKPIERRSSVSLMRLVSLYLKADRASGHAAGFTLVELLVALIVSTIMVTILLGSAVQLMGTNQREAARSDTQRDVQAALDYIARDMREAVYVYDGECLKTTGTKVISAAAGAVPAIVCPGILQRLPVELNSTTNLPVLAFWRVDPLPEPMVRDTTGFCRSAPPARPAGTTAATPLRVEDSVPCSSRSMYTLVVYSVSTDNPTTWAGRSRITRYQLPQYSYSGSSSLTITPGWISPVAESAFLTWPRAASPVDRPGLTITQAQVDAKSVPSGGPATDWDNKVLVDFIDNRSPGVTGIEANLCPAAPIGATGTSTPTGFIATPSPTGTYTAATIPKTVFYACVRGSGGANLNQEVLLRIRANGAGRGGVPIDRDLPLTMETRVLTRGVLGKS